MQKKADSYWKTTAVLGAVIFLSHPSPSLAWGDGGHMMVAKIAEDRLNPKAKAEADRLLAVSIKPFRVTAKSKSFIEAAHWADDVRPLSGFEFSGDLHFVDFPFSLDNTALPDDLPKSENIVKALNAYVDILKTSADDNEKAEALRFVIHFVGDIHQPLHCATKVSKKLQEGDRGGNDFKISERDSQGQKRMVKLHSFWDGGIETFPRMGPHFQPPPLSEVVAGANALIQKIPDSDPGWKTDNPFDYDAWAQESFRIATQVVYKGLQSGKEPSQAYKQEAIGIAERRVVSAGYRLAALLNAFGRTRIEP